MSLLQAIQQSACVTASTFVVKLNIEILRAALSLQMVVVPCFAVKLHPDWPFATEPSVYYDEKFDL